MLDNVGKGLRYLKERGVREFASRAVEKYGDRHFDYDAYIRSQALSPIRKGYQRSLRMPDMPAVWVMLLEGEARKAEDDGRDREGRGRRDCLRTQTISSLRRQTYEQVEISDLLTTRTKDSDLVVFVRCGDLLPEDALFELAMAAADGAICLYTDQDAFERKAGGGIHYKDPLFKPGYDPDYLRSFAYIGRLFAVRAGILRQAASLSGREDLASAQCLSDPASYYNMLLLCTDLARGRVTRIPKVLCHTYTEGCRGGRPGDMRLKEDASSETEPGAEDEAARAVLSEDLERRREKGIVEYGPVRGTFHIRYLPENVPLVSIVIPNKDQKDLLAACLDSLHFLTSYENLEIVIVENNSEKEETFAFYRTLEKQGCYRSLPVRVIRYRKRGFHFSEIVNLGVSAARGEYVVLMNNDVTVKTTDWVERLLGQCCRREVGAAGPKLLYPDGTVQSAGIVTGLMGFAGSMMVGEAGDDPGYMARACVAGDMSAVTAALMMVRKDVFEKVGGFPDDLAVALGDVDFCLKVREAGFRIVFDPTVVMVHHESKSRGYENTREKRKRFGREKKIFQKRWEHVLKEGDPYYNPNLSDRKCDYSQKK